MVAGCSSRPAPGPTPPTPTAARQVGETTADNDGVTADEPAIVAQAVIEPPAAASLLSPTAPVPTTAPTAIPQTSTPTPAPPTATPEPTATFPSQDPYPLQIEVMRQQSYPGSEIVIEQTLAPGSNYSRYVVSYLSDGYKIYALMTVPNGPKPATGWPAIIFNHGYIPPAQYRTTERYVAYVWMRSPAAATSSSSPTTAATAVRRGRPRAPTATPAIPTMCSTRWRR